MLIVYAIIVFVIATFFFGNSSDDAINNSEEKWVTAQFSGWDGSHREFTRYIKSTMKNPNSYEHVSTSYRKNYNSLTVRTTYRGTNSFGAVVTETATAEIDKNGKIVKVY